MDKNKDQKHQSRKVKSVKTTESQKIKSDVQGSYTGVPTQPFERPIQDADDL